MGGRGGGAPGNAGRGSEAVAAQPTPADFRRDIARTAAAQAAARNTSGYGSISAVRDNMAARGITSREEQDAALRDLVNSGRAAMIPMANLKALSARDREEALFIGGERKHLIRLI